MIYIAEELIALYNMNQKILDLIDEQKSPLFRIMSITNGNDPARRMFDNNISASHIGNGFVLSVAHNLISDAQVVKSIDEPSFQNDLLGVCNPAERLLLLKCYLLDIATDRRTLNIMDNTDVQPLINFFQRIQYDTRWTTLYAKGFCKPYLIIQFVDDIFYQDAVATALFNPNYRLPEPLVGAFTFMIELEVVEVFHFADIALYKIVNTDPIVVNKIPYANLNFDAPQFGEVIYCLQSSPSGTNMGRLLNEAKLEGFLDHHSVIYQTVHGTVIFTGLRYFLKCYFRFGSSGAPFFVFNQQNETFEINAVQSEASPIQLSINNNRDGNFQYINAIASPIKLVTEALQAHIAV